MNSASVVQSNTNPNKFQNVAFPDLNAIIIQEVVQLKWNIFKNFQFLGSEKDKISKYILDKPKVTTKSHNQKSQPKVTT